MTTDADVCQCEQTINEMPLIPRESEIMAKALTLLKLSQWDNKLPILDLACGSGRNGLFLQKQGFSVVYADKNQSLLATIKQFITQAEDYSLEQAEFWRVDFEEGIEESVQQSVEQGFEKETALETKALDEQYFNRQVLEGLAEHSYQAIIVCRYLHRPLMPLIKRALAPGGCIIYETFTREQATLGRPRNPNFLLNKGELVKTFSGWQIKHDFEGTVESGIDDNGEVKKQAIAQLMALKP